jgi:O-antigen/teichoic acid export membrane protein
VAHDDGSPPVVEPIATASPTPPARRAYSGYVALMVVGSSLGLIKGLIYAQVLDPQEFGYYGLVVIVLSFGLFLSNWGILSALNNHLPIAFGKGRHDDPVLLDRSMGALLITSSITAGLYLGVVALLNFHDDNVQIALLLAAFTTIALTVTEFHILVMRVQQGLMRMGMTYFLRASLTIVLGTAAAVAFGYRGVILAEFGALLVTLVIARRLWLDPIGIRRPSWRATKRLIRAGSPLMVANVIVVLAFAADRLFVAAALPDDFGQYAFAALVVVAWIAITAMLEQAVAPRLLREYGAGMKLREVRRQAFRVVLAIGLAGLVGLGVLIAIIGPLENGFLAEYEAGLETMPILYAGGLLLVFAFPGFVLHAVRPGFSVVASVLAASVSVAGGFILLRFGNPTLAGFAWVFVAGQTAALTAIMIGLEIEVRRDTPSPHILADA